MSIWGLIRYLIEQRRADREFTALLRELSYDRAVESGWLTPLPAPPSR